MTPQNQILVKTQMITDLRLKENILNGELHKLDTILRYMIGVTRKRKHIIAKQISHNMRFRNKIINEVTDLKKQL